MYNAQIKRPVQIIELFGGIGAPHAGLTRLGIPTKSIDYVEIDEKAVKSYNAMFKENLKYRTQSVIGWNLKPDILVHGSPCQDFSIAGHQGTASGEERVNRGKGGDKGSGTRSSLMWETLTIIRKMGIWKPRVVIWENVKNVTSVHMIHNFHAYLKEMERLGYTNSHEVLNSMDFGIPQDRDRNFVISIIGKEKFDFSDLIKTKPRPLSDFLEKEVGEQYIVTQPSILNCIGEKGIRRTTVIKDKAYTITTRQDRTPAQVIELGNGKYRYLTEKECWLLQGYTEKEFERAKSVNPAPEGKMNRALYKQAGNSITVPIFESIFRKLLLEETINNKVREVAATLDAVTNVTKAEER